MTITAGLLPHGAKAETIAVFTKNTTNPFSKAIRPSAPTWRAKKLSVNVVHYMPTTADNVTEQTKLVNDAIAAKPDAILFDPVDHAAMGRRSKRSTPPISR